ncbi:Transmembrane protein 65 [Lamellibrachia satsuma]|nr:Transmembrane protein 65 [Lamellibrachia satsuma]
MQTNTAGNQWTYAPNNQRSVTALPIDTSRYAWKLDRSKKTDEPSKVTWPQLRDIFIYNGIPFIGFGFLDNALMIVAGEYIDVKICVVLGLSTMAAAAWGNLISDIAGVGCAGYVEMLAHKIGVTPVHLTPEQAMARSTRWTTTLGRSSGLFIGCLLGMVPLLFYSSHKTDDKESQPDET